MSKTDPALTLFETLRSKLTELQSSENPTYLVPTEYRPSTFSGRGSQLIKDGSRHYIIDVNAELTAISNSLEELGDDNGTWLGYPISDWKADCKTRFAVINRTKNMRAIQPLLAEAESILTNEQKREIKLADLTAKVKNLLG
jgi:hypothetical protein